MMSGKVFATTSRLRRFGAAASMTTGPDQLRETAARLGRDIGRPRAGFGALPASPASPATPPPAPGAAARTESPDRNGHRSREDRPRLDSLSIRSAMRSMPKRPSRSEKSAGWMLDVALPVRLSSNAAGTLMKRKPRAVNSRGSMRRSARLSMEKRNPRSARAPQGSHARSAPCVRTASWVNSNTSDGAMRAVGLDEFEQLRKSGIGQRRRRKIAEQADVAVLEQQPPHHLHASQHRKAVELRQQRTGLGVGQEIRRPRPLRRSRH